jgi:hypothetical protein
MATKMIMKVCPVCKGAGHITRIYYEPNGFTEPCLVCNGVGELLMPYVKPPKKPVVKKEKSPEEALWAIANERAFCIADIEKALWGLHYDYRRFLKYDIVRLNRGWYISGKLLRERFNSDSDEAIRHFNVPMPQEYYIPKGLFTEKEFYLIVQKTGKKCTPSGISSTLYHSKDCVRIGIGVYCHKDLFNKHYNDIEIARKEWENHMKSKYVQGQYILHKEKGKCVVIDTPSYDRATYRLRTVDGNEDIFAPWWDLAVWKEK